jgi:hypothetical protein
MQLAYGFFVGAESDIIAHPLGQGMRLNRELLVQKEDNDVCKDNRVSDKQGDCP